MELVKKIINKINIIGLILALCIFVLCSIFFSIKAGIVFSVILVFFSVFSFKTKHIFLVCLTMTIVGTCFASQMLLEAGMLWGIGITNMIAELICAIIVFLLFFFVTSKETLSLFLSSMVLMILSIINYFVFQFRGSEFIPTDIFSITTATNVASNYSFELSPTFFYGIIIWIIILYLIYLNRGNLDLQINKKRLKIFALNFIFVLLFIVYSSTQTISTWSNEGTVTKGYFVNFGLQLVDMFKDKKPSNYSLDTIKEIENDYTDIESGSSNLSDLPNVIVVMDETFADLRVLNDKLKTEKPVTPFIDSLKENTIKGYALCSVFGGGTANSEYEVLTGDSMGFMSDGATVYQLYLKQQSMSMASYFSKLGYKTIATHPYYSSGWSRTKVYPLLGFEEYSFIEDYPQKKLVRNLVSDQEMFEYIVNKYENKNNNDKLFLFGVTMQNHSPYDYSDEGYTPSITLEDYPHKYPEVEQYLGLINETDKAVKYLINYFNNIDEKTVVLFFGDHLPRLNETFYEELYGGSFDTLEKQQLLYTVPFFIWANYDIEEEKVGLTSLNYLSNYLYKAANIELPAYNMFLLDIQKNIPAMNSKGYYSLSKNTFLKYEDAAGIEKQMINQYEIVHYNYLFDKKNKSKKLFE